MSNTALPQFERDAIQKISNPIVLECLRKLALEKLDRLQSGAEYTPCFALSFSEQIHRITFGQTAAKLALIEQRMVEVERESGRQ